MRNGVRSPQTEALSIPPHIPVAQHARVSGPELLRRRQRGLVDVYSLSAAPTTTSRGREMDGMRTGGAQGVLRPGRLRRTACVRMHLHWRLCGTFRNRHAGNWRRSVIHHFEEAGEESIGARSFQNARISSTVRTALRMLTKSTSMPQSTECKMHCRS
ncbi:hypothetical protein DFH11DRAFT_1614308 [Phellopilus nigrolimitatus]|nr:hypothetical protein DFH11DRAFT_1614308 [Phellopilus nigrolimitatus]